MMRPDIFCINFIASFNGLITKLHQAKYQLNPSRHNKYILLSNLMYGARKVAAF